MIYFFYDSKEIKMAIEVEDCKYERFQWEHIFPLVLQVSMHHIGRKPYSDARLSLRMSTYNINIIYKN